MRYLIDTNKKFDGSVYTTLNAENRCMYGGETVEELQARYPKANFKIIENEELDRLIETYINEVGSEPFKEISEERYWDLMNCLPPERMGRGWFYVGEPYNFDLYLFCFTDGERFFAANRRIGRTKEQIHTEISEFLQTLKQPQLCE